MARIPNENEFVLDIDIEQSNEINKLVDGGFITATQLTSTDTINGQTWYTKSVDITFSKTFPRSPGVSAIAQTPSPFGMNVGITNLSATGMTVHVSRINQNNTVILWNAVTR